MRLISTGGRAPETDFREALLRGLAPDGGLYVPAEIPRLPQAVIESWRGLPFADLAASLAGRLLAGEFQPRVIDRLVRSALDFPAPTIALGGNLFVLELFHGPTMAFKDFGARFLGQFFGHLLAERGAHATILVATSGDTGSAVAHGFASVPNTRVVVLYPRGKVSPFQEAQMATLGGNVTAVRVPGVFDDCQRLVKAAFQDSTLGPLGLSSANSINIGRLLPQSFYYVASYLAATASAGDPVVFSVPSGNLGDLTAGLIAKRMGVPISRLIAATNANDVLPEFLETGVYRARPSRATLSNAMDVGDPSNFPRVLYLCGGLASGVRAAVDGIVVSEEETRAAIRLGFARFQHVLDPHGAVGLAAALRWRDARPDSAGPLVFLETAHPAKFGEAIRQELGREPELPPHERNWRERPLLAVDLPDKSSPTFRDFLLAL
jgi:threonine synthase